MSNQNLAGRLWGKVPQRAKIATQWNKGTARFGDPAWFKAKPIGWGLTPTSWRGWVYTGAWSAAITLPFVLLVSWSQIPEAVVWLGASGGALAWDVRQILTAMNAPAVKEEDVFYIGDEPGDSTRLTTRNFDLQVRQ